MRKGAIVDTGTKLARPLRSAWASSPNGTRMETVPLCGLMRESMIRMGVAEQTFTERSFSYAANHKALQDRTRRQDRSFCCVVWTIGRRLCQNGRKNTSRVTFLRSSISWKEYITAKLLLSSVYHCLGAAICAASKSERTMWSGMTSDMLGDLLWASTNSNPTSTSKWRLKAAYRAPWANGRCLGNPWGKTDCTLTTTQMRLQFGRSAH